MSDLAPPFRLYDFLSYLFPGLATLHVWYLYVGESVAAGMVTKSTPVNYAVLLVASYVIGLFWSAVSRDIIKPLCRLAYDPRVDLYAPRRFRSTWLNVETRKAIEAEVDDIVSSIGGKPRIVAAFCRSYVAQNCAPAWARRENVSSVRAMATNFIGPVTLYGAYFLWEGRVALGVASVAVVVAMLRKSMTHDSIEWKEIYVSFLSHRVVTHQAGGSRRAGR